MKKKRAKKSSAGSINVKAHLMSLMGRGFTRLYDAAKDEVIELQTPDSYQKKDFENVYVLVNRLAVRADSLSRLVNSLEICFPRRPRAGQCSNLRRQPSTAFVFGKVRV